MTLPRIGRARALALGVAGSLLLVALAVAFLQAGRFLTPVDAPEPVDAIVAPYGATVQRVAEITALYKSGYARRIILSNEHSLVPGLATDRTSEIMAWALVQEGVPPAAIDQLDAYLTSTAQEAVALAEVLRRDNVQSILLVGEAHRQRREQLSLAKATAGQVRIVNRPAPHPNWQPERWWQSRFGVSAVLNEYLRLAYYAVLGRF